MRKPPEGAPRVETEPRRLQIETAFEILKADKRKSTEPGQDAGFVSREDEATCVCDGMGGKAFGDVAATIAADTIRDGLPDLRENSDPQKVEDGIRELILRAHQNIVNQALQDNTDMRTTIVVSKIVRSAAGLKLVVGWVGDSRLHLVRNGVAQIVTLDDGAWLSVVPPDMRRREQEIQATAEQRSDIPDDAMFKDLVRANMLTQSIGGHVEDDSPLPADTSTTASARIPIEIDIHTLTLDLQPGDILVATSDGVHGPVPLPTIGRLVSEKDPRTATVKLMEEIKTINAKKRPRAKDDDKAVAIMAIEK